MAIDHSALGMASWDQTEATSGTANNATLITAPSAAKYVGLHFVGSAGKFRRTGTDAAAIGADFTLIPAGNIYIMPLAGAAYYVASAGTSVTFHVTYYDRRP